MQLRLSSSLVLALLFSMNACAGSHKHAEVPDFTEKGWSEPNPAYAGAKGDPLIQPAVAKNDAAASPDTPVSTTTTTSATESTQSPPVNAVQPAKAKNAARKKKKKKT